MTEKEFDQKVEDMAARFERGIEASAAKLEKGVTHKYGESRLFRFTIRGIFIAAEIGLLIGGKSLVEKGHRTAAIWCVALGAVGFAAELLRILACADREFHTEILPFHVCAGADRLRVCFRGASGYGSASYHFALTLWRYPCRPGKPPQHYGGTGYPFRPIRIGCLHCHAFRPRYSYNRDSVGNSLDTGSF